MNLKQSFSLSKGDFTGFNILVFFLFEQILIAKNKIVGNLVSFTILYGIALVAQIIALLSTLTIIRNYLYGSDLNFYLSYISSKIDWLNPEEKFVIFLSLCFGLIMFSSKILSISRIGLVDLSLSFKEEFEARVLSFHLFKDNEPTSEKLINGAFGTLRALLLNTISLLQSAVAIIALSFISFEISIFLIIAVAIFIIRLSFVRAKKTGIPEEDTTSIIDENEDLPSSASFNRIEGMRHFGRSWVYFIMFSAIVLSILISSSFTEDIALFGVSILLIRVATNCIISIAVISAASKPFKDTLKNLTNLCRVVRYHAETISTAKNSARYRDQYLIILFSSETGNRIRKEYLDKKKKILISDKTIDRSMISIIDITQKRYRRLLSKKDMLRIIKKRKVSKYGNLLFTI